MFSRVKIFMDFAGQRTTTNFFSLKFLCQSMYVHTRSASSVCKCGYGFGNTDHENFICENLSLSRIEPSCEILTLEIFRLYRIT